MSKKVLYTGVFLFNISICFAQGLGLGNAAINIGNGATVTLGNGAGKLINNGSSQIINSGTINVTSDFTNNGTATVDNDGTFNVAGDWTNNAGNNVFVNRDNTGLVNLNGSSTQTLSGITRFENLAVVNTTANTAISLSANQIIEKTTTLTDGIVTTNANSFIVESTTAADLTGYSDASFINGNLRRHIAGTGSYFGFPVGNGTTASNYHLIEMEPTVLTAGTFTYLDSKIDAVAAGGTLTETEEGTPYTSVATEGEWHLVVDNVPTSIKYNIKAHTTNISGLEDNKFSVLKRATGSSDAGDWSCTPCGFAADPADGINTTDGDGRMVADGYALRRGFTSFSKFVIGKATAVLPVELIEFSAQQKGASNLILWQTATEINSDYFEVEKSENGKDFHTIVTVIAAGNSNETLDYDTQDNNPFQLTYYRLKQFDFDGSYVYSNTVKVARDKTHETSVSFAPNPANDFIKIVNLDGASQIVNVKIYDATGKLLVAKNSCSNSQPINLQNLSNGIYYVLIEDGNTEQSTSKRLVISR